MDDIKVISRALAGAEKTVLIGFPGSGLVGSIALQYLVDQMDFDQIGAITSKYFPPVALMTRGVINAPYASTRRITSPQSYPMSPSTR